LTPIPILKVLSTFRTHKVRALLIGGQACIVYGAAEFTRDTDFVVRVNSANMKRLRAALAELEAEPVFFPPLRANHLLRGHACHFRCTAAEVVGIQLEVVKFPEAKRGFVLLPRRWVVERSFAWAARFKRLARDYERLEQTLVGMHFLVFAILMLAKAAPLLASA
jgi:hypothetical protein